MTVHLLPGLHWGIKASFLDYVSRMPDGRGTIGSGATPTDGNVMVFEHDPVIATPDDVDLLLAFRGDVRFAGHGGMLFVRIADPHIAIRGDRAELTVLHPYEPDTRPRLRLASLTVAPVVIEGARAWESFDVRLTAEGTELFNDVYPAGELFEPLAIHLPTTDTDTAPTAREEAP